MFYNIDIVDSFNVSIHIGLVASGESPGVGVVSLVSWEVGDQIPQPFSVYMYVMCDILAAAHLYKALIQED